MRTFQAVNLFSDLTVLENIEVGALGFGASRAAATRTAWQLLERFILARTALGTAAAVPAGKARLVGILRALAARPRYLLLDEPAAGLNEAESTDLVSMLTRIRDDVGCGIVVIEHDMRVIMNLCERIHVLDHGTTIANGTPSEVQRDAAVLEAYLGTRRDVVGH